MCNTCCCCCGATEPTNPPTGGGDNPPPTRCVRYQVNITSIDVSAIDDGFLGGTLETTWTFVVNGQVQTVNLNDLDVGVTAIGISFFVDVPTDTSTITLQVSAIEDDPLFDDTIAGFAQTFGQAQNWGLGAQSGGNSDSNITYRINYQITCASKATFTISRKAVAAYGAERARTRKGVGEVGHATQVSWGLERLRRGGWELIQATGDNLVFSGNGKMMALLDRKYGGG